MPIRVAASLATACACGQESIVSFLVDLQDTDIDAVGADGVSPLCAATIWGYDGIVRLLLEATCDPNVRNADSMRSTALHAAASQEHGKIVHLLLQAGANATLEDGEGRTACDFASVSDAVWPLFAARGLQRTPKSTLVEKRVIHKIFAPPAADERDHQHPQQSGSSSLTYYSRPGSAYARSECALSGSSGPGTSSSSASSTVTRLAGVPEHDHALLGGIDPLERDDAQPFGRDGLGDGQPCFSMWRD